EPPWGAPRSRPEEAGQRGTREGGAHAGHDTDDDVGGGEEPRPAPGQPHRLVGERRVGGQRPAQPGAEQQLHRVRGGPVGDGAGEQPEDETAGHVDGEGAPGEDGVVPLRHAEVGQVPQGRADGAAGHDQQPVHRARSSSRPAPRRTSHSSSMTRPPATSSSSWGRNARTRVSSSTITTATGRSSLNDSSRVVWISEEAPNPSIPRNTDAPASPALWARCTISVYSGLWCQTSFSPTRIVRRRARPGGVLMAAS